MKKSIYIFLLLTLFMFSSCQSNDIIFKEVDISLMSPDYIIGVNHGITKPDNVIRELVYDGNPITVSYYIDCYQEAAEFGLVVFIDGVRQPYVYSNEKNETYMKILSFSKEEKKEFSISFTPAFGKSGQVLSVMFCTVLEPRIITNNLESPIFGFMHSYSQQTPWKLLIKKDICDNPVYNSLSVQYTDFEATDTTDKIFVINKDVTIITPENGKAHLDFELYSEYEEKYRFLVLVNHELVRANNALYHDIISKPNQLASWSVDLDWNETEKSFIYGILIPIKDEPSEQDVILQTESKLLLKR